MTRSGATPPGGGALSPVIATFPRFCTIHCITTFRPLCQDKFFIFFMFLCVYASSCVMHVSSCVYVCIHMMGTTPTHSRCVPYLMGYPPIHIGTYVYVCACTHTAWGTHPPCVPTCTYHCVYTYVYMQVPVLPAVRMGPCAWASTREYLCGGLCGGSRLRLYRVASPPAVPPLLLRVCAGAQRAG